ncbi:hypothetical protein HL653_08010 [Sphingomonas sp. AP4-R1]|uniref:barstar family protein n=1 Tax=Sphingomonas sp. AP4-R1 TaxID=2735134 RepID=UPI0014938017|nr:barstar family protein [Sphingomonas sp. AP4-R1]QJU57744.1 hypothetical protein HL653_08010 [Sphingomonas sp. AP4-R1]
MPMKLIQLDGSAWMSPDDFFAALLPALGAPSWHGRSLNALDDSLYGGINEVEPPFTVVIAGVSGLSDAMRAFLGEAVQVFVDARKQYGQDVALELR